MGLRGSKMRRKLALRLLLIHFRVTMVGISIVEEAFHRQFDSLNRTGYEGWR